jgi:hypothetical protein
MGKSRWLLEAIFENSRCRTNVNETTSNLWEGFLPKCRSKFEGKILLYSFRRNYYVCIKIIDLRYYYYYSYYYYYLTDMFCYDL